jgi:hypothetical protein
LAGTCEQGFCKATRVAATENVTAVAADDSYVYWADNAGETVAKVSLTGGEPIILATQRPQPSYLVADESSAFWSEFANGSVMTVDKDGVGLTILVSGRTEPAELVVDASSVYWLDNVRGSGSVMAVAKTGGAAQMLAPSERPDALVLADGQLYFSDDRGIVRVSTEGGAVTLVTSDAHPRALTADATHLYFVGAVGAGAMRGVARVPLRGGTVTMLANTGDDLSAIAVDARHVYYGEWTTGRLLRRDLDGTNEHVVYTHPGGSAHLTAITLAADWVIFSLGRELSKLAK